MNLLNESFFKIA